MAGLEEFRFSAPRSIENLKLNFHMLRNATAIHRCTVDTPVYVLYTGVIITALGWATAAATNATNR